MAELNHEIREMTVDELEQVSGGSIINWIVDQYLAAVGARLIDAVHQPLVSKPTMSLHIR